MFNIKNIVNKITDRGRESQPNSPGRGQGEDILSKQAAEGFLCPKCMLAFPSPEDLQGHYLSSHDGGGADESEGFLCPICLKSCSSPEDLEEHFLAAHGGESDDTPEVSSSLNFLSLHHEVAERYKQRQDGNSTVAEHSDLQGITDVDELRRRLVEALESKSALQQEKEHLEQRAAQLARDNVSLKAASDEGEGNQVALKERLKVVEAQLAHRESIDDAAVLRQELVQVQRVMDELTREKERERDALKAELQQLKDLYAARENSEDSNRDVTELRRKLEEYETQVQERESLKLSLESCKQSLMAAQEELGQSRQQVKDLQCQQEMLMQIKEQRDELEKSQENRLNELKLLQHQLEDFKSKYESTTKIADEKEEEIKSCQARLDALNQQKDILKSEFQHKSKLCEELEKTNSAIMEKLKETEKSLSQKKEAISRLESERAELLVQIEAGEGANTAIQQLSQEKVLLTNQLKEQSESNAKILQEMTLKYENSSKKITGLEAEKDELCHKLNLEISSYKNEKAELQKIIANITSERDSYSEKISSLESNLAEKSKLLTEHIETVKTQNAKLESIKQTLVDYEAKIKEGQDKLRDEERKVYELQTNLSNLEKRLNDSVLESKQRQEELDKERARSEELQQERDRLKNELSQKEEELVNKEKTVEEQKCQIETLQKSLSDVKEKAKEEKKNVELEWKKDVNKYKGLLHDANECISKLEGDKINLGNDKIEMNRMMEDLKNECASLTNHFEIRGKKLAAEIKEKEDLKLELAASDSACTKLQRQICDTKMNCEKELEKKGEELKKLQSSLDEVAGEKLALEAQLAASQSEQQALLERCYASSAESENQRKNNADLRHRLEESQAALHELGRENQTLQLELEKLLGRKWTEDSDVISCTLCQKEFSLIVRKHHCRNCGQIFCNECSSKMAPLQTNKKPVRVCDSCYNELSNK